MIATVAYSPTLRAEPELPVLQPAPSHSVIQAQSPSSTSTGDMTLERLATVLRETDSEVQGANGQWQLTVGDRPVVVLADASRDRMRIIAPVVAVSELSPQSVQNILLANFHTSLDARYAISDDTLVSVFVHPLRSLEEDYLRSAISQVATLADTFGTTYSSGGLGFGPGSESSRQELHQPGSSEVETIRI
ncbi:YbjN domain-containing protein [Synechococcus sp. PCC 7335]|uniref:YbjN domain-containing protein n=1 Tax=Synechococcus sp. (strain ATCC 29403 / PCC 7335) TaxID=91464 RepID=UPI0002FE3ABD|nr:YbjN domain-containing protein [Synechococcus sp. PCC 7335]